MHIVTPIKHLWSHHKYLFMGLCLAIAVFVFFTVRLIVFAIYWADPAHRFQPLEGWMTPSYISRSYQIPPEDVGPLLGLDKSKYKGMTLGKIAQSRGMTVDTLIAELQPILNATKDVGRD